MKAIIKKAVIALVLVGVSLWCHEFYLSIARTKRLLQNDPGYKQMQTNIKRDGISGPMDAYYFW